MTQWPQGGKLPRNQEVINSLNTQTKIDLLRKSDGLETLPSTNVRASLQQINEAVRQSTSENPLNHEQSTEVEFMSIQSQQDGFFFPPDKVQTKTREGMLKVSRQGKSPFLPASVGSQMMTAPGTSSTYEAHRPMTLSESGAKINNSIPQTAIYHAVEVSTASAH